MNKLKRAIISFVAFMMMVSTPKIAYSQSLGEVIIGIGTGLLSGAICRELGASRDLQAFCAIGGALIGVSAAREMNRQDAEAFSRAQDEAFRGDVNRPYQWDARPSGSRSGVYGQIIIVDEGYHYQTREVCRVYQNRTHYGRGQVEEKTSTVCRRGNGSLYTLENVSFYRRGRLVSSETRETETYPRERRPVPRPRPPVYEPEPLPPVSRYCEGWSAQDLRLGDRVYTRRGLVANYQGYNNYDDSVVVRQSGYTLILNLNDIAISGCHYGIRTNDYIRTRNGINGYIVGIFMNGDIAVDNNRYVYIVNRYDIIQR
jgi:surface antigen